MGEVGSNYDENFIARIGTNITQVTNSTPSGAVPHGNSVTAGYAGKVVEAPSDIDVGEVWSSYGVDSSGNNITHVTNSTPGGAVPHSNSVTASYTGEVSEISTYIDVGGVGGGYGTYDGIRKCPIWRACVF